MMKQSDPLTRQLLLVYGTMTIVMYIVKLKHGRMSACRQNSLGVGVGVNLPLLVNNIDNPHHLARKSITTCLIAKLVCDPEEVED
jgi:hypothetical protein